MKRLIEDALALMAEAVGESGTISVEDPESVQVDIADGPRFSLELVLSGERDEPRSEQPPILWVLRRPKKGELEALRAEGQSFVALTGAVRIQVPGLLIDRTDLRRPTRTVQTGQRSAFSDRASLVPRWLFSQATHGRWSLTSLATAAGVSPSVASYAVRDLAQKELVEVENQGRERWIRLIDHRAIVEAWAREYGWRDNVSLSVQAPMGSTNRFMARLPTRPLPRYALTLQGGATLSLPHAPVEQVSIYVDVHAAEDLSRLARRLKWPPDPLGRLHFLRPYSKTSVWAGLKSQGEVPVVSDLQLILDLWNHPIRGREQAELILEKHLQVLEEK